MRKVSRQVPKPSRQVKKLSRQVRKPCRHEPKAFRQVRKPSRPLGKPLRQVKKSFPQEKKSFSQPKNELVSRFYRFWITSRAFSIGLASTALSPTSTIGRWMIDGSAAIAFITSSSGVSAVMPLSLTPASAFRKTSYGRRPVFLINFRSFSSVKASLK